MADYSLQALARYLPQLQNLNVQSLGQGAPMVGGSLGLPAVDPNLSVEGGYHRPDAVAARLAGAAHLPAAVPMPYRSDAQRGWRIRLPAPRHWRPIQGAEWDAASKGKSLPARVEQPKSLASLSRQLSPAKTHRDR